MHRYDTIIRDIESRLNNVINITPSQTNITQTSLAAYGWVLLDSYIAWRTLRFLLKKIVIDDYAEKWFGTPSSYTQSQLKSVWAFREYLDVYVKDKTNLTLKGNNEKNCLIAQIIAKRNTCAHFNLKNDIQGVDVYNIDIYFNVLKNIFFYYELNSFINDVVTNLKKNNFSDFYILKNDYVIYENDILINRQDFFYKMFCVSNSFKLDLDIKFKKNNDDYYLFFHEDGSYLVKNDNVYDDNNLIKSNNGEVFVFKLSKGYYLVPTQ